MNRLRKIAEKARDADERPWHSEAQLKEEFFTDEECALIAAVSPEVVLALCDVAEAADKASLQYGASNGRKIPEMELLGYALARLEELTEGPRER